MYKAVLALAFLACAGSGRRLNSSVRELLRNQLERSQMPLARAKAVQNSLSLAEADPSNRRGRLKDQLNLLNVLGSLLLSPNSEAAFKPSGQGLHSLHHISQIKSPQSIPLWRQERPLQRSFIRMASVVDTPDPIYNSAQRFEILYESDPILNAREHESTLKEEIVQEWLSRMKGQEHLTDEMWSSLEKNGEKDVERFVSGAFNVTPEGPNPFAFVQDDVKEVASGIVTVLDTYRVKGLKEAARFFFEEGRLGKQFRSTSVFLMAKAVDCNPATENVTVKPDDKLSQLAQVTEMIHTASLIHDDVLDDSDERRGEQTIGASLGVYPAALTGDYLLSRASILLARLQNNEVTRIMSGSLEALVTGEVVQMSAPKESRLDITAYLKKSYFKTASLIASALRSVAVLAGNPVSSEIVAAAEAYGFHVGLVFQIVDDILDFSSSSEELGKPAMADVQLGLATAPIIYAAQENKELKPLILRKFDQRGDVEKAYTLTLSSNGIARARELAQHHANAATKALLMLPPSPARDALERLNMVALERKK